MAEPDADTRVPVTVLTGYLGAGKTTLLNTLLRAATGKRLAVIVNEFGDAGVDGELVASGSEDLIELSSGCICCVVRGDLIRTLRQLLSSRDDLDGILIETTGLANPSPVIQTFAVDQILAGQCRLDAVVTVVDGVSAPDRLEDSADAVDQIALASILVLNKASEVADRAALQARLRAINPHAPILACDRGRIAPTQILGTQSFSLDRVAADLAADPEADDHHRHHIDASGITSVTLRETRPLDGAALENWIGTTLAVRGADILRMKGILAVDGEPRRVVLQAVNMLHEGDFGAPWPDARRDSRLVFIGRNLNISELQAGFQACISRTEPS